MKQKIPYLIVIVAIIATAFSVPSCKSRKDVLYLQDIDTVKLNEITTRYEAKIKKDDLLSIVVTGPDKQVVAPYNLNSSENGSISYNNNNSSEYYYLVDINGDINFPILGKIHVEGMTRMQLVTKLTEEISKDVKDPIVNIAFKNYKITILGEVRGPGTYTMNYEKVTLFQALAAAGDLPVSADREGILLIREVNGTPTYHRLNLKSAEIMNSEYFYMQQNDVLYVPPSAATVATGANASIWGFVTGAIATVLSLGTMITTIVLTYAK